MPRPTDTRYTHRAEPFRKRLAVLKNDRSSIEAEWRDIADYVRPRRGIFIKSMTATQARERRSTKVINPAATLASRTCGSGMASGISSPSRPWFKLRVQKKQLRQLAAVREWTSQSTGTVQDVLAGSNFYNAIQQFYRDTGDFGNSAMVIDEDWKDVIRCTVFAPGQYYIALGGDGRVNTFYAEYRRTVLQLVEEHGLENVTAQTREHYNQGRTDHIVNCVMAIEPNMQQIPGERGVKGMPFVCVYFEETARDETEKGKLLDVKGYREWPVAIGRWDLQSGEVYAWGPGLEAVGDAKSLQALERRKAQAIDKLVTPPVQAPGLAVGTQVQHLPGGVTHLPMATNTGAMIRPLYEQNPAGITAIANEIQIVEQRINQVYYADLFLMLSNDQRRQPVTAREIDERHEEKLLALGPVLDRLHNEALNVAIDRVFYICMRRGLIPRPPDELQGQETEVHYTSLLAQAQRAVGLASIERTAGFVGNLLQAFPAVADKFDADQAVDEYADALDTPVGVIRPDETVETIREQKQQQESMAQGMAAAQQGAQTAQILSQTDVGNATALDTLLGMPT